MKNKGAIIKLYEALEQEHNTSPKYANILKQFNKCSEAFRETLKSKQKLRYDNILRLRSDMESAEAENWFIKGYETATRLIIEGYKKEN